MLSCADRVSVISKDKDSSYVGGIIDNSKLDEAITEDLAPQEYPLEQFELDTFSKYTKGHKQGTIIRWDVLNLSFEKLRTRNLLGNLKPNPSGLAPIPNEPLPPQGTLGFRVQLYGAQEWGDLFTVRQKFALHLVSKFRRGTGRETI